MFEVVKGGGGCWGCSLCAWMCTVGTGTFLGLGLGVFRMPGMLPVPHISR